MASGTIDFGIDLGTTNSAIAILRGTITEIIKNSDQNDITPSAVMIDKRNTTRVGKAAKTQLENEGMAGDVFSEFKRQMGKDYTYRFKSAGRSMKPEDLSAEILKSVLSDAQRRFDRVIQAAVVTVPAAFEQRQCAATKSAGELAGLQLCPLLQEPVAASLAYGFQAEVSKAYWLVYDFGGGTFDAAVIKADEGSIHVVNHGGDNYLGGSDIDNAIIDQIIAPILISNYNFPEFSRSNKRWSTAIPVLKRAAESAKIELSASESAYLYDCKIKDDQGNIIELDEIKLNRNDLIRVVEPIVLKSTEICKRVLKEKNLSPSAIERLILVGGPTLAPYFREIIKKQLGIQLDSSVDPLTVVARGAAVFAGTQRLEGQAVKKASIGQFNIDIKYDPIGPDTSFVVRGKVSSPDGVNVDAHSIEFTHTKTNWKSGKIPLKSEGLFKAELIAEKGVQNTFQIELSDSKGIKQISHPSELDYTVGLTITEQPIINSIAISTANNEADVFFKKGDPLPSKRTKIYRTTHSLKKGESGDVLKVPVVEGENELADRNRLLGYLEIMGKSIRRDLPAGQEVEVTLIMDESRTITVKAYLPILDEEIESTIHHDRRISTQDDLLKELAEEIKRLEELRIKADDANDPVAKKLIQQTDELITADDLEGLVAMAGEDPVAAGKAEKLLLELKVHLDGAEDRLKWPALVNEVKEAIEWAEKLVAEHGAEGDADKLESLKGDAEQLIDQKRHDRLSKMKEEILNLGRRILHAQDGWWVGYFNRLEKNKQGMSDQVMAERLFAHGRSSIQKGDVAGLKQAVIQLVGLLPDDVAEIVKRGYGSGISK